MPRCFPIAFTRDWTQLICNLAPGSKVTWVSILTLDPRARVEPRILKLGFGGCLGSLRPSKDLESGSSASKSSPWRGPSSVVRERAMLVMPVDVGLIVKCPDVFFLNAWGKEPMRSGYRQDVKELIQVHVARG